MLKKTYPSKHDLQSTSMFRFQPGDVHPRFSIDIHHKGNRAFGRDEGKAGVVEEVIPVKKDDAGEAVCTQVLKEPPGAEGVFGGGDGEGGEHDCFHYGW